MDESVPVSKTGGEGSCAQTQDPGSGSLHAGGAWHRAVVCLEWSIVVLQEPEPVPCRC